MIRDLGLITRCRAHKLDTLALLQEDRHEGRGFRLHVGSGTGKPGLPVLPRFRDDGWSGLLVEPHSASFARREALHSTTDQMAVLNPGKSDVSASLPLSSLKAKARSRRSVRDRASLIRDRAPRGRTEGLVIPTEVPFLDTALRDLGVDSTHLVAINAGGHKAQVLQSFERAAFGPSPVLDHATHGTASQDDCIAQLTAANRLPVHGADGLLGVAPDRLSVPLEELLTCFRNGLGALQDDEE